jgi:hypothetical protein
MAGTHVNGETPYGVAAEDYVSTEFARFEKPRLWPKVVLTGLTASMQEKIITNFHQQLRKMIGAH